MLYTCDIIGKAKVKIHLDTLILYKISKIYLLVLSNYTAFCAINQRILFINSIVFDLNEVCVLTKAVA